MGFLPRSEVQFKSLIGDDELDFNDIFGQDRIHAPNPHLFMEKLTQQPRF